jgi:hypothetical protein
MNLNATDTLELVTSATATIDAFVSFKDDGPNASPVRSQATAITTADTTTICDAPASATARAIESITVRNKGATSCTVTVQTNGASTVENYEATLTAEGGLTWTPGAGWVATTVSTIGVPNLVVLAADVANSGNNAAADVTGLSFAVVADLTYWFRFSIPYTAAATTTGSRWMVNGPTSPTALSYRSSYPSTATAVTTNFATAYDIPAAANTDSLTAGNTAIIEGFITPSAAGTVIARFASEVNASAITAKAGAILEWKRVI